MIGVAGPAQASTAVPTMVGSNDRDLYDSYRAPNGTFYEFGAYFAAPRANVEADGDVWISVDMRVQSNRKITALNLDWIEYGPSANAHVYVDGAGAGKLIARSTDGKRVVVRYTVKVDKSYARQLGYGKNWYLGDPWVNLYSGGKYLSHWRTETGHPWATEKFWVTGNF
jgi:hypothetical protein